MVLVVSVAYRLPLGLGSLPAPRLDLKMDPVRSPCHTPIPLGHLQYAALYPEGTLQATQGVGMVLLQVGFPGVAEEEFPPLLILWLLLPEVDSRGLARFPKILVSLIPPPRGRLTWEPC